MTFIDRPDKYSQRYGNSGFTKRDLYINDLESYCDAIEKRLVETQEALDKLLAKVETINRPSWA